MKQIRRKVFETNSSSCHSLVYAKKKRHASKFKLDKNGYVCGHYGEFEYGIFTSQSEKLSYLLTHAYYEHYDFDLENSYIFQQINAAFKEYIPGCNGVKIYGTADPELNHQLQGELLEIVDYYDTEAILDFVFCNDIYLKIYRD